MDNFNDLENDIAGDWLAIQQRIQEDERKEEELNTPKRMHCRYKDFYRIMYKIMYDGVYDLERSRELHEMLRMVLSGNGRMPEGFEKLWDAFCDSYTYDTRNIECMSCGEVYDILYKRVKPILSYEFGQGIADAIEVRMDAIYCPKCSRIIGRLEQGTFISLTTSNIHEDRNMEEGGNDFKY